MEGLGGDGNGAAIVINTDHLVANNDNPFIISKVKYETTQERDLWYDNLAIQISEIVTKYGFDNLDFYTLMWMIFTRIKMQALFSKHRGFHEENVWRVVYFPDRDQINFLEKKQHYQINSIGAEPKLKFKLDPVAGVTASSFSLETITEKIILGPSHSNFLSLKSVQRMFNILGYADLSKKIEQSRIPYRTK